jgi:hypothetical protein
MKVRATPDRKTSCSASLDGVKVTTLVPMKTVFTPARSEFLSAHSSRTFLTETAVSFSRAPIGSVIVL